MMRVGQMIIAFGIVLLFPPMERMEKKLVLAGFFMIGLGCAPIFPGLLRETPENFGERYSHAGSRA